MQNYNYPDRLFFYGQKHLATITGTAPVQLLRTDMTALAERYEATSTTSIIQSDRASSVLGTSLAHLNRIYTPYGLDHTAPTFLGFTGQPTDPVTGCYPLGNGHRFYNPAMMRFHQPDTLSPFHRGATNSYTYALGDPVNLHDPSGQLPQFIATGVTRTVRLIKRVLREAINQALAPPAIAKDYLQPILSTIVATAENASRQLLPAATPLPLRLAVQTGVAAGVGASIATAAISYSQTGTMLSVSPWEAIGIWYMGSATPEQQIALGFQVRQPQVPDHMNKFLAS